MFTRILIAIFLLCSCAAKAAENSSATYPFVIVYSQGDQPVENVSVAITNTRKDVALLITSVEFDKQLPELTHLYGGVYGSIEKQGNNYQHNSMEQMLSRKGVGTCFLLPEQSMSWKRPMRVLSSGYHAHISWQEIPAADISKAVWFTPRRKNAARYTYEPLSEDKEKFYRSIAAAANDAPPEVVLEGQFPSHSVELDVACINESGWLSQKSESLKDFPKGSVEYHLDPIADSVVVTGEKVIFRKFNWPTKSYEIASSPNLSPIEIDFIYMCKNKGKKIPCILDPNSFGDIIEVKRPYREMYYDPGITEVPIELFPKILARAQERKIPIVLRKIAPNSLSSELILAIGVELDDYGRQKNAKAQASQAP